MSFFLVAIAVLTMIYGVVGIRLIQPSRFGLKWKLFFGAVVFFCYAAIPFTMVFRFNAPGSPFFIPLSWFSYVSFGFFTLAFCSLVFRDALLLTIQIGKALIRKISGGALPSQEKALRNPERRQFIVNASNIAVLGVTGSLTGFGLAEARQIPEIVTVDVPLENLPPEFNGFRILQITDLHVSTTIRKAYVQGVVERANEQKPDMVVFTGDLADGRVVELRSEVEPLSGLKAEFGNFFVTGNHEYYSGVKGWIEEIKRLGWTPLLNENRVIRRPGAEFFLAGVTDYRAGQIFPPHASNPKAALADVPEGYVKILLAHQPKSIFQAEPQGVDLMISGHTHGGQYFPFNYFIPMDQPYVYGFHKHGKSLVYVSRGTGYWGPPMRLGAPSEITVLRLLRKPVS